MSPGRIIMLIIGILLALAGMGVAAAGAGAIVADTVGADGDGYLTTPTFDMETTTHAVTAEELEFVSTPGSWTPWRDRLDLRLTVAPTDGTPVFVGIAPRDDVTAYLDGVAHDEVQQLDAPAVGSITRTGDRVPGPPAQETFWTASVEGSGSQTLDWTAESGRWAVVVMNADASAGVTAEATAGASTDLLLPLGIGLLVAALILLGGGTALIVAAVARREPTPIPAGIAPAGIPPAGSRVYPVAVVGHLDPQVSRWQWLFKWLLLIPHVVVLAFLWIAFAVLTIVAGFAILFTGRYPRGLFEFNVGVLRWTWRVVFYGYSALGTDRYPPFTLAPTEYPADLDVVYPTQLSRGLVLVKWWLLAIPHYLIVAVLTGGAATWTYQVSAETSWQVGLGGGLIGVLVLVAAIALLFTARYPAGLFDLVVGLNRWVYRVIAYAALMTDDYPPFRLDSGGDEPRPAPPTPPGGPADVPAPVRTPQPT
jgi:hypothetical protein